MQQQVLIFPVLPTKTADDARRIGDEFMRRPDEYVESRRQLGVSLERAYLQTTPMGLVVVVYAESEDGFDAALPVLAKSDLAIDTFFIDAVRDIHGFDMTQPPPDGSGPETLGVWTDPNVSTRGRGFAFCAPLLPGMTEAGRAFTADAYGRDDMTRSRRALGVSKEVVTAHETPHGDFIAVYFEGDDPVAGNAAFAASTDPFDLWFKGELAKLFPPEVDFSQPVPGIVEIFDSATITG